MGADSASAVYHAIGSIEDSRVKLAQGGGNTGVSSPRMYANQSVQETT